MPVSLVSCIPSTWVNDVSGFLFSDPIRVFDARAAVDQVPDDAEAEHGKRGGAIQGG